jgi:hypothetical protein
MTVIRADMSDQDIMFFDINGDEYTVGSVVEIYGMHHKVIRDPDLGIAFENTKTHTIEQYTLDVGCEVTRVCL